MNMTESKLFVGSNPSITNAKPLDGMDCPRCHGAGWVFVVKPTRIPHKTETVREVCPRCHGTGEPQDGHMDGGLTQ